MKTIKLTLTVQIPGTLSELVKKNDDGSQQCSALLILEEIIRRDKTELILDGEWEEQP
jgi:hypothetical protein